MKALVLHEPGGPLVLEERPLPRPRAGEALVRVRACGLGLTLVWNKTQRSTRSTRTGRFPRVIGHEIAGDVESVGDGVDSFTPGDRVAVYYYLTCGDCPWCRTGREDLCDHLAGHVGRQIDGGLAEYVVVPVRQLCPMPDEVSYVDAAVATDAVATPLHVLSHRARLQPGERVLVIGAGGGVGIHVVAMARALGARVAAADLGKGKVRAAMEAGAEVGVDASISDVSTAVTENFAPGGVDVVVDMVGISETFETALASVGKGGRVIFVGTYDPDATLTFRPWTLGGSEIAITGSRYCTYRELADTLEMIAAGQVVPVVSRTCRLDEAEEVLRTIEAKALVGRAAVVFD